MLFDCRNEIVASHVQFPDSISFIVVSSGISHVLAGGEYAKRPASCDAAVQALQIQYPEVRSLRDATPEMLKRSHKDFVEPLDFIRATHVVNENLRVLKLSEAVKGGDMVEAGWIMNESHASLRDNYDITIPEIDAIVDIARGSVTNVTFFSKKFVKSYRLSLMLCCYSNHF